MFFEIFLAEFIPRLGVVSEKKKQFWWCTYVNLPRNAYPGVQPPTRIAMGEKLIEF